VLDQPLGEPLEAGEAHEGDERARDPGEGGRVERLDVVRCERRHRRRDPAMRDGDAGRSRNGCERRHAGDDLERHVRAGERQRLLAAAPEKERISALQAHDAALPPVEDEEIVHLLLREAVALDAQRIGGRLVDELLSDEPVEHDHVTCAHARETLDGDQARVARAAADDRDAQFSALATASRNQSRRSSYESNVFFTQGRMRRSSTASCSC